MKKIFLSAVIFLTSQLLFAQTESVSNFPEGRFALQFQVKNNFTIGSFQGSILSGKYVFKNGKMLRAGLSLSNDTEDNNSSQAKDTLINNNSSNHKKQTASFRLQYLFFFQGIENIYYYLGAGPYFGYSFEKDSNVQSSSIGYQKIIQWGLEGAFGVEWFFDKKFSLSAEYDVLGYYARINKESSYVQYNSKYVNNSRIKKVVLSGSVKLGISIYF